MTHNDMTFGGVSTANYGLTITDVSTPGIGMRDIEAVEIPGRKGALLVDNGGYKNYPLEYELTSANNALRELSGYIRHISGIEGYAEIYDTYYKVVRWGYLESIENIEKIGNNGGKVRIKFSCSPGNEGAEDDT